MKTPTTPPTDETVRTFKQATQYLDLLFESSYGPRVGWTVAVWDAYHVKLGLFFAFFSTVLPAPDDT